MRPRSVLACGVVCVMAMSQVASGQTTQDPETMLLAMLRSPDPRQQAWGAWYAGRDDIKALVPALEQMVADRAASANVEGNEGVALSVALDALIQMRASVPPDLLPIVYSQRPAQALILASIDDPSEASTDFLLDVVRHGDEEPWFAAANLLLQEPPPGFARALLTNLQIKVTVTVSDDGDVMSGESFGMTIGCGIATMPRTDLPPIGVYDLTTSANPGVVVLAGGPRPVYYWRALYRDGATTPASSRSGSGPHTDDRLQYLAALAHVDQDDLPVKRYEGASLAWRDAGQLDADVRRVRADVTARFAQMLKMLVERHLLDADEAKAIQPDIQLTLNDARSNQSAALTAR